MISSFHLYTVAFKEFSENNKRLKFFFFKKDMSIVRKSVFGRFKNSQYVFIEQDPHSFEKSFIALEVNHMVKKSCSTELKDS